MALHQDFRDLLEVFASEEVRYLLVGGYAVAFHSVPRPNGCDPRGDQAQPTGASSDGVRSQQTQLSSEVSPLGLLCSTLALSSASRGADALDSP